jgi:hypothetical protein
VRATRPIEIRDAYGAADIERARALFAEYARSLDVDLCFQGFEQELATLPGAYTPPRGCLLLAGPTEHPFGCIALRPLPATLDAPAPFPACGEVKRLYVHPAERGTGGPRACPCVARAGARHRLSRTQARHAAGDDFARALYASSICECDPYYANPLPGGPTCPAGCTDARCC